MKKLVIAILACSLMLSCSENDRSHEIIKISDNLVDSIDVSCILGEVEYIAPTAVELEHADKIIADDEGIYILDYRTIHRFGHDWDYSGSFNVETSQDNYWGITDFDVHNGKVYVLDRKTILHIYNFNGECIMSAELGFYAATIKALPDGNILVSDAYQADSENKFHLFNGVELQEITAFSPIKKQEKTWRHFMGQSNFFVRGEDLLFHEPMNNTIYSISDTLYTPEYTVDLYGRNAPDELLQKEYGNIMEMMMSPDVAKYCYGTPIFAEIENRLAFTYKDGDNYRMCVYDKKNGNSIQSGKISFGKTGLAVNVGECLLFFNDSERPMIAVSSKFMNKEMKGKLNLNDNFSNIVICIKK